MRGYTCCRTRAEPYLTPKRLLSSAHDFIQPIYLLPAQVLTPEPHNILPFRSRPRHAISFAALHLLHIREALLERCYVRRKQPSRLGRAMEHQDRRQTGTRRRRVRQKRPSYAYYRRKVRVSGHALFGIPPSQAELRYQAAALPETEEVNLVCGPATILHKVIHKFFKQV